MNEEEGDDMIDTKTMIPDQEVEISSYLIPKNESRRIQFLQENESFQRFEKNRYLQEITKLASSYFNVGDGNTFYFIKILNSTIYSAKSRSLT